MKTNNRIAALTLALTLGTGIITLPLTAQASEEGKRNTTLALGAVAAALLLTQKNKVPGLIAAGAAGYAYTQYDASVNDRHRRERDYGYDYRYNNDRRYNDDHDYNDHHGSSAYHENNASRYHENSSYHSTDSYRNQDSQGHYGGHSSYGNSGSQNGYHQTENSDGRAARAAGSRSDRSDRSLR